MSVVNCNWDEFEAKTVGKRIYCFGAGVVADIFLDLLKDKRLLGRVRAFVDNSPTKVGGTKSYEGKNFEIVSLSEVEKSPEEAVILITCSDTEGVVRQLEEIAALKDVPVYGMYVMLAKQFMSSMYEGPLRLGDTMQIPKKIHYCWFGHSEMPQKNREYIESWRRNCPDYEIIEWNERNYDYTKNQYMYEAYRSKKWGFVPDYARLDIIYEHGGIYLDVDVEIMRNIDDLLYQPGFCGFDSQMHVNFGSGFGAKPRHELIKEFRDYYDTVNFVLPNGQCDLTPCQNHQRKVFGKYGIVHNGRVQNVGGMTVYPAIVMNGTDMNANLERVEECTCFCHRHDASWHSGTMADARRRRIEYISRLLKT